MRARGLGGFWALALLLGRAAGAGSCLPWPGEPLPLPRRADPDALRALWADLRIQELNAAAREIETERPLAANRLWQHVLCLDPASEAARSGLARTPVIHVVRPTIERATASAPSSAASGPWSGLEDAIVLSTASSPSRQPAPRSTGRWDARGAEARIREAREHLRAARFSESLAAAAAARRLLESAPQQERDARVPELEIVAATAELALGQEAAAQRSLLRALRLQPDLALDPAHTSPKVLRALEAARAASGEKH